MIKSTRNAHAIAMNPYQGDAKRVLTVCSAGVLRSPTAANVLRDIYGYNTRSCGHDDTFALIPISTALVEWAEEIVFVNEENYTHVINNSPYDTVKEMVKSKATVLHIPDQFAFMSVELQNAIKSQYENAIKEKG